MNLKDAVNILKSRKVITRAHIGHYVKGVRVTSCNPVSITNKAGLTTVAIANFSAHTEYGVSQAQGQLRAGQIDEALNHNMSLGLRENDEPLQKGMIVDLFIEEIINKAGTPILVVNSVRTPKAIDASKSAGAFSEFEETVEEPGAFTVSQEKGAM